VVLRHDPEICGNKISATDYSDLQTDGIRMPRLEDVLARFGRLAYLDIEIKIGGNESAVVAALRACPPTRGYIVSSFLPEVLRRAHELDPCVPLGYICDSKDGLNLWTELPIAVLIPHHKLISRETIQHVRRREIKLFAWTVNQRRNLVRLAGWGADGLISDDPALLKSTFLEWSTTAA